MLLLLPPPPLPNLPRAARHTPPSSPCVPPRLIRSLQLQGQRACDGRRPLPDRRGVWQPQRHADHQARALHAKGRAARGAAGEPCGSQLLGVGGMDARACAGGGSDEMPRAAVVRSAGRCSVRRTPPAPSPPASAGAGGRGALCRAVARRGRAAATAPAGAGCCGGLSLPAAPRHVGRGGAIVNCRANCESELNCNLSTACSSGQGDGWHGHRSGRPPPQRRLPTWGLWCCWQASGMRRRMRGASCSNPGGGGGGVLVARSTAPVP